MEGNDLDGYSGSLSSVAPKSISTLVHEIGVVVDIEPPRGSLVAALPYAMQLWQRWSSSLKHV